MPHLERRVTMLSTQAVSQSSEETWMFLPIRCLKVESHKAIMS